MEDWLVGGLREVGAKGGSTVHVLYSVNSYFDLVVIIAHQNDAVFL